MDENAEWQNKLKKALRSIKISIHNQTDRQLRLIHSSLRQGTWVTPPPDCIDVNQKVEFGAKSSSSNQFSSVSACLRFELVPIVSEKSDISRPLSTEQPSDSQQKESISEEVKRTVPENKLQDSQQNVSLSQTFEENSSSTLKKEIINTSSISETTHKNEKQEGENENQMKKWNDQVIEFLLTNNFRGPSHYIAHSHSKEFRVVSVVIRGAHARITFLIQRKTINLSNNNDISLNQNLSNSEATTPLNDGEVYISWDFPVVVFVNKKSGGRQGKVLLEKFKELLPSEHIVDIIAENGPKQKLEEFRRYSNLRILACGGDGTGKWIMETIDTINYQPFDPPPVGVLPLGTGNDIARVLGWGGGYNEGEPLHPILNQIVEAEVVNLDRWLIERIPYDPHTNSTTGLSVKNVMNNYLALGFADAKVALNFHQMRDSKPGLFFDRKINKVWYLSYGARAIIADVFFPETLLHRLLRLYVNGKKIHLKKHKLEGLIVLNLPSYAAGRNLWGIQRDPKYSPVSMSDGLLEVIGIRSTFHMAQIGAGLDYGIRLAQGNEIRIILKRSHPRLPSKIDGEPWLQTEPVIFQITFLNQGRMLARLGSVGAFSKHAKKTGWLHKFNLSIRQWRLRYFILIEGRLVYFLSAQEKKPQGEIKLKETQITLSKRFSQCFKLITPFKTFYISCKETKEPLEEWIKALEQEGATRKECDNSLSPKSPHDSLQTSTLSTENTESTSPPHSQRHTAFSESDKETLLFMSPSTSSIPHVLSTNKSDSSVQMHRRSKSASLTTSKKERRNFTETSSIVSPNQTEENNNNSQNSATKSFSSTQIDLTTTPLSENSARNENKTFE